MVTIKLVGGLGNQLFGYFAGKFLEVNRSTKVRFDISDQLNGLGAHKVSILDLNLEGDFGSYQDRAIKYLPFKILRRIARKILRILRSTTKVNSHFQSEVVGHDENLLDPQFNKKFISGYFQSSYYFSSLRGKNPRVSAIGLRNPSPWLEEITESIKVASPIIVHIRRGDYLKFADSYGILSDEYFCEAIGTLREKMPEATQSPIWVFSDSIETIPSTMPRFISLGPVLISPPEGTSDSEVLIAMSMAKMIVISNSTYSWWSASLNSEKKIVIAPTKWYRNMEDPSGLIPEEWTRVSSLWD
jgi:hypothetical protein